MTETHPIYFCIFHAENIPLHEDVCPPTNGNHVLRNEMKPGSSGKNAMQQTWLKQRK
jgi:hypothetical protein